MQAGLKSSVMLTDCIGLAAAVGMGVAHTIVGWAAGGVFAVEVPVLADHVRLLGRTGMGMCSLRGMHYHSVKVYN